MSDLIRVLCLFTILNRGGAETMCMNLYRNIDRNKVQFDFLVYHKEKGVYEEEISSLGGRIYRISHPMNIRQHIKDAREFFNNHREYRIVHNHMQSNGCIICREAKRAGIKTIIYHSHSAKVPMITKSPMLTLRRARNFWLNSIAIRNSNYFFACGESAAEALPTHLNVTIIRNAISIDQFKYDYRTRCKIREEFNCSNKLVVGHVGRFDRNKNQVFAIKVYKKVLEKKPNSELWLIGDGVFKDRIVDKIKEEGLQKSVRLLGVRTDVSELLQAMDVFIFPSIAEGLPVSCIEAQTAGLQCVFSNGFDTNTVVTDNCRVLSLTDPLEKWANVVIDLGQIERTDTSDNVRRAGYDIKETSKFMENFYLSKAKG